MSIIDIIINLFVFVSSLVILISYFYKDGKWALENSRGVFRFFTVLSNLFCGLTCLMICLFPAAGWAWVIKYIGTAAVTVTLLTVFIFLGPSAGGVGQFLKGSNFLFHFFNPLLAIVSFLVFERRGMSFLTSLWGMVPVAAYGLVYLYKVIYAPEGKKWEDFYGYNKGGKWPIAFAMMMAGGFVVCMAFMLAQGN